MNSAKNNEIEVKNFLHVLEQIAPPDKTTNDLEQAVQYAKTWAKAQIQYFSITSDGNEANTPPAEMRTPRRLYRSRIPLRSVPVENDFNFQRSGSLKYRSTPKIIKAPRSSSTGRISNSGTTHQSPALNFATLKTSKDRSVETLSFQRSGSLKFRSTPKSTRTPRSASLGRIPISVRSHKSSSITTSTPKEEINILRATSPPDSPFLEYLSKPKISVIEQSPFARYKSKSRRNKSIGVMKPSLVESTPNSSGDYEFKRSSSFGNGILKHINKSADQSMPITKSSRKKKSVKFASSEEQVEEIASNGFYRCASRSGKSSRFTQELKNILTDVRNIREALRNNSSFVNFFK